MPRRTLTAFAALILAAHCYAQQVTVGSGVQIGNFVTIGLPVPAPTPPSGATGDSRTVVQPTIPTAICAQVAATKFVVSTNQVNIDPYNPTCGTTGGTQGTLGCTGGTDFQPSSSSSSYVAAETTDNTAVQNALNSCPAGQAVELVPGSSGQYGFVLAPWHIPSGVSVLIDPPINVFESRNRTDFAGTNCGLVTAGSSSCSPWITATSTTGSGIYGFGTLDGRGWSAYTGGTTPGFYYNRVQMYCAVHGGASHGSPVCLNTNGSGACPTSTCNSYGPNMFEIDSATGFTLYGPTLKDSGQFFINWKKGNGFTGWDVKIRGPFEIPNTDGWDPLDSINGTWEDSFTSNGDNQVAVKATDNAAGNITYTGNQTYAGIGFTLGSDTTNGISNILVTGNVQNGNLFNDESTGLMIGTNSQHGGAISLINYQNDCMMNEQNSIRFYTNYGGSTGSNIPNIQQVVLQQVHVLASTAPYTTGNSGTYTFQGLNGTPLQITVNGLAIDGVNQGVASQNGVTKDQYATIKLGPGSVPASVLSQFTAGTSVTQIGSAGSSTPYPCTASMSQALIGDINLKNAAANYNSSLTQAVANPYTLQAVMQPATEISIKESAAPTASLTLLDNGTSVGTATLTNNFAQFTISSPPSGTHVYQWQYPGDTNYGPYTFGSITVVNP